MTSVKHTLYASGNFGKSAIWSFLEVFILFYLTDVLALSPALAGLYILLSLLWDGVSDPLIGHIADRFSDRFKTALPYVLIGAPLAALSFIALFALHSLPAQPPALILIVLLLFRSGYTLVDVPHNAMLALITDNSKSRTFIASLRIAFSGLGKLMMSVLAAWALSAPTPQAQEFQTLALILSGLYLFVVLVSLTAYARTPLTRGKHESGASISQLFALFKDHPPLTNIFVISALTSLTTPAVGAILVYWGNHGPLTHETGEGALIILALTQAGGLPLWLAINERILKTHHTASLANGVLSLSSLALFIYGATHGPGAIASFAAYAIIGLIGLALGGIFMLNWVLLPRAIDSEPSGRAGAYTLSIFGLFTFTNKLFIGASGLLGGLLLSVFNYQGANDKFHSVQAMGLIQLGLIILGALGVIALLNIDVTKPRIERPDA